MAVFGSRLELTLNRNKTFSYKGVKSTNGRFHVVGTYEGNQLEGDTLFLKYKPMHKLEVNLNNIHNPIRANNLSNDTVVVDLRGFKFTNLDGLIDDFAFLINDSAFYWENSNENYLDTFITNFSVTSIKLISHFPYTTNYTFIDESITSFVFTISNDIDLYKEATILFGGWMNPGFDKYWILDNYLNAPFDLQIIDTLIVRQNYLVTLNGDLISHKCTSL
jgi:hypothetical protein